MTGPELYQAGCKIISDIVHDTGRKPMNASDQHALAALASACFAGAQAAAFGVMAAMETDGDDEAMSAAWAQAIGLNLTDKDDEDKA